MQEYTSKDTCINTVNKVYKVMQCQAGSVILDYGGGKYDSNKEFMAAKGVYLFVYDPYNRSKEHNAQVLSTIQQCMGADIVVCSNVLNVIKEENIIQDIVKNLFKYVKPGGKIYIQVYEGNGSGIGKVTNKGYQRNEKMANYLKYLPANCKYVKKSNMVMIDVR